jgi:hypothetical protein
MDDDKRLLEAAAKAAGLTFGWIHDSPRVQCADGWTPWSPLTDDGDALRLAVKLCLPIDYVGGQAIVNGYMAPGMDASESARRAVVRAAAAMAKETA